jgi:alanyl-tRNA synthetase
MRRIADHVRAAAFCIADGVLPSNSERGYVLRRLLRRAALDGRALDIEGPLCYSLVPSVAKLMSVYPEISERRENIARIIKAEEEKFGSTLEQGMQVLEGTASRLGKGSTLSGEEAFRLYDTYGFPLELAAEVMSARGILVDREGFEREMQRARERSRAGAKMDSDIFGSGFLAEVKELTHSTEFVGYETPSCDAKVLAIISGDRLVEEAAEGAEIELVTDRTPFYGESGGQVGDSGDAQGPSGLAMITDTTRAAGIFLHRGKVAKGRLRRGETVRLRVDAERRENIARNHTATHLLHHRLRHVLGKHVEQSGSLVTPERLRLDFSHFQAMTEEELDRVEELVNRDVQADGVVRTRVTTLEEAKSEDAMALFGEKYGERVRLVSTDLSGAVSRELCGGTHLDRTGRIGLFRIASEGAIAAGFRRIEAVTGLTAYRLCRADSKTLDGLSAKLKVPRERVTERVAEVAGKLRETERELAKVRSGRAAEIGSGAAADAREALGVRYVVQRLGEATDDELRSAADAIRGKLGSGVVLLAAVREGHVALLCAVTDDLVKSRRLKAGDLIKPVAAAVGGGGGGRPSLAQAGGKDPSKLDEALAGFGEVLSAQLARK